MSKTRYAQVARDLADGIKEGRFPVGSLLPTELELCALYGASRQTVRTAIKELQDQELVSRRKKLGTRVEARTPPSQGYRASLTSIDDLVQFGTSQVRVIQEASLVTTDKALARTLGCAVGRVWLRISSVRNDRDGLAIGWTDVYLDETYADIIDAVRERPETLVSSLVEDRYGRRIAEVRQDVEGVLMDVTMAKRLASSENSAALRVVRKYFDSAGACFEISISVHPAGRFTLSTRLKRKAMADE